MTAQSVWDWALRQKLDETVGIREKLIAEFEEIM